MTFISCSAKNIHSSRLTPSICDRLWENPPSGENLKKFVMVKFIIYGPLALYCANFKAIAFMTPEEQLLERSR